VSPRRLSRTSLLSFSAEGADGFPIADALGSIRALYNPEATPVFATTYDAYGTEGPYTTGENPIPYGFVGERSHPTGLYWLRARFYNPGAGSFMSRDQYSLSLDRFGTTPGDLEAIAPQMLNPYSYANSNPATVVDPSGEFGLLDKASEESAEKELRSRDSSIGRYVLQWVKGRIGAIKSRIGLRAPQLNAAQRQAVEKIVGDPHKMEHLFDPKHNLSEVVKKVGSEEALVERIIVALGSIETAGVFERVVAIEGTRIVVRGVVKEGIIRIGTWYVPRFLP
jgi:RHS repeat-associated protein